MNQSTGESTSSARDRLFAMLLAIIAIVAAGAMTSAIGPLTAANRVYAEVEIEQRERVTDTGSAAVMDVRVGDRLARQQELAGTPGRWVVVDLRIWSEVESQPSLTVELHANGKVYRPVDDTFLSVPVGFTGVTSSVFEVPAEAVAEFSIVVGRLEIVQAHQRFIRLQVAQDPDRAGYTVATTVEMTEPVLEVAR